jgi:CBS domain-containing protein
MKQDVMSVRPTDSIQRAAQLMREEEIGFLPVCEESGKLVGTLTDRDIAIRVSADDRSASGTKVGTVCTKQVISCAPDDDIRKCAELMSLHKKSRMPICDRDDRVVGIVSLSDLAQYVPAKDAGATLREVTTREV